MSIADHFDHAPDRAFVRSYDSKTARRQFQISVALVVVLALAAFSLGFLLQFEQATAPGDLAPTMPAVMKTA